MKDEGPIWDRPFLFYRLPEVLRLRLRSFTFLTIATKILINSSASVPRDNKRLGATTPPSESNSSQYVVSSNSCKAPSILLMKSASDFARQASR